MYLLQSCSIQYPRHSKSCSDIFELSFTAPVWFSTISIIQEGRLGQRLMKLFAEGLTAILSSAAFQHCLRCGVVLSSPKVLRRGFLALFFFLLSPPPPTPHPPTPASSSCVQAEWNCRNWWSKLAQTSCQINFPCLCGCGAVWQESAGAEGTVWW